MSLCTKTRRSVLLTSDLNLHKGVNLNYIGQMADCMGGVYGEESHRDWRPLGSLCYS